MDGVVLVALPAGTLHLSRSLSPRFDRRHPRSDRMNLAALVFALHNFAENTLVHDEKQTPANEEEDGATAAAIALFATPDEQLAAAVSPSKKLLVALFTSPSVDSDVAKWIATRVARNMEKTDSVDARIMATLNHLPGLLRSALTRAVESLVDRQLTELGGSIRRILGAAAVLDGMVIGFCYRYGGSDMPWSSDNLRDADADEGIVLQSGDGDLSSLGTPPTAPPTCETRRAHPPGKLTRLPSPIEAGSSVFLSTRSLLGVPRVSPDLGDTNTSKKKHKKSKRKAKNAVADHAEPRVFQRLIGLGSSPQPPLLASQCSSSTIASEQIAALAGSLLDAVAPSPASGQADKSIASAGLRLLTWRNPPLKGATSRTNSTSMSKNNDSGNQNELVAWQHGLGIVSCLVSSRDAHQIVNNAGIRLQIEKLLSTTDQAVRGMLSA